MDKGPEEALRQVYVSTGGMCWYNIGDNGTMGDNEDFFNGFSLFITEIAVLAIRSASSSIVTAKIR